MGSGASSVGFHNSYGKKIFVAYMYRDPGCQADCGEEWNVEGWINLLPGERQTRPNPTENRWFFYFAEAEDGATWSGTEFSGEVRRQVFSKCTCLGSVGDATDPFHLVGMAEIDTRNSTGVNFVPG